MQQAIFWTVEEVAAKAKKLYADKIRSIVEHEDNIGKRYGNNVIDSLRHDRLGRNRNYSPSFSCGS